MAKIIEHTHPKITEDMLNPELWVIFKELPHLIDFCEENGRLFAEQIITDIKEEIAIQPEQRDKIILSHRDKYVNRYKELINSGLRLKATNKEEIIHLIGLQMIISGTWEIPLPKDCAFNSLEPEPKGHIHTAIAPLFRHYAIIQACNELLNPDGTATDTTATQNPEPETTEQKIKRILEPLRLAFDTPGHIDKIVKALVEYSDTGELPAKAERKVIQVTNPVFYPYFKRIKNETNLTAPGIADVLAFFICSNNGTLEPLAPGTIIKNIHTSYPEL